MTFLTLVGEVRDLVIFRIALTKHKLGLSTTLLKTDAPAVSMEYGQLGVEGHGQVR